MLSRDTMGSEMTVRRKPVLGLIGGIGAGKTAAGWCLAARGGFVIDCDQLGHAALEVPDVKQRLIERWGERILHPQGLVNRRAIAGIVFGTSTERAWLESVVFPVIGELAKTEVQKAEDDPAIRFVVLDAAVLLEAGWKPMCDKIAYIDAPRELRLQRLANRSKWTTADLAAREAAQWPAERKKQHADVVVVNDGSPEQLQERMDHILKSWNWMT
jgi:dephospho-CoA kinase